MANAMSISRSRLRAIDVARVIAEDHATIRLPGPINIRSTSLTVGKGYLVTILEASGDNYKVFVEDSSEPELDVKAWMFREAYDRNGHIKERSMESRKCRFDSSRGWRLVPSVPTVLSLQNISLFR